MEKVNLFISYSHPDKKYLPELLSFLNETTCPQIDIWYDDRIALGEEWNDAIKDSLNNAEIVLLIISQDFLNSPYIQKNELTEALKKHDQKASTVIPIFLRYCNLANFPQITKLQGYPGLKTSLLEMGVEKDRVYTEIQEKLNSIAEKIVTEKNISLSSSDDTNNDKTSKAKEIEQLRNTKKIFLSLPDSDAAKDARKNFIISVEGKIKYDTPDWPYEVVPGIADAKDLYAKPIAEQQTIISSLVSDSIYTILIAGSLAELTSPSFKMQYEEAKKRNEQSSLNHNILWFLDPAIQDGLAQLDDAFRIELKMLPAISGNDCKSIFKMIDDFDLAKERKINELKTAFSQVKKVFMFYDYAKDNENDLRINLRKKIQEDKDCAVRDLAYESFENEKKGITECEGAVIFYGKNNDSIWYKMRESIILKAKNIKAGAVCVDGAEMTEIEKKIDRDVSVNEVLSIKGASELDTGIKAFKQKLNE